MKTILVICSVLFLFINFGTACELTIICNIDGGTQCSVGVENVIIRVFQDAVEMEFEGMTNSSGAWTSGNLLTPYHTYDFIACKPSENLTGYYCGIYLDETCPFDPYLICLYSSSECASCSDNPRGNIEKTYFSPKLFQNYPNPFNPATKIQYLVSSPGQVRIAVFDLLGKEIANLVNEYKNTGYYTVDFNAANLSSGIYIYKMEADNFIDIKRMLVVK